MDIHEKLARHLSALGMGYPVKEELIEILKGELHSIIRREKGSGG
jgi:hypothetical protein